MQKYKKRKFILSFVSLFSLTSLFTPNANAGTFGAEIFCTMRDGGNDHESSWEAAYTYIKKQKGGLFKTSPNRAAAQIVETVVRQKDDFSYCVQYLNQLHPDRKLQMEEIRAEKRRKQAEIMIENEESIIEDESSNEYAEENFDRYSY